MNYTLTLSAPPTAEPVTVAEARFNANAINIGGEDEQWFEGRIRAGRQKVEDFTQRSLAVQTLIMRIDGAIPKNIPLPKSPAREIVSVSYQSKATDAPVVIDVSDVSLVAAGVIPSMLVLPSAMCGILTVEYVVGYDADKLPEPLRDAILLYVAHAYNNREGENELPKNFFDLITPYRIWQ